MYYGREQYDAADDRLNRARYRESAKIDERLSAPGLEKYAVIAYQSVRGLLEYLRGESLAQLRHGMDDQLSEAQSDALKLNSEYEALKSRVENAASVLNEAIAKLKGFEVRLLEKGPEEKANG